MGVTVYCMGVFSYELYRQPAKKSIAGVIKKVSLKIDENRYKQQISYFGCYSYAVFTTKF